MPHPRVLLGFYFFYLISADFNDKLTMSGEGSGAVVPSGFENHQGRKTLVSSNLTPSVTALIA